MIMIIRNPKIVLAIIKAPIRSPATSTNIATLNPEALVWLRGFCVVRFLKLLTRKRVSTPGASFFSPWFPDENQDKGQMPSLLGGHWGTYRCFWFKFGFT